MPPHCDSLDGPVVAAARLALDADDVALVLPYVPEEAEAEVRAVFDQVTDARVLGGQARAVADRHFFETAVRLHRLTRTGVSRPSRGGACRGSAPPRCA